MMKKYDEIVVRKRNRFPVESETYEENSLYQDINDENNHLAHGKEFKFEVILPFLSDQEKLDEIELINSMKDVHQLYNSKNSLDTTIDSIKSPAENYYSNNFLENVNLTEFPEETIKVLVIGNTKIGKSYFINQVMERDNQIASNFSTEKSQCDCTNFYSPTKR
jgi:ribosome biogenesis GTPase A